MHIQKLLLNYFTLFVCSPQEGAAGCVHYDQGDKKTKTLILFIPVLCDDGSMS